MKFRYIVFLPDEGTILGTNDPDIANQFSKDIASFVVDAETGDWLLDTRSKKIEAIAP